MSQQNKPHIRDTRIGNVGDFTFSPFEKPYSVNQSILMEILQSEAESSSERMTPHIKSNKFERVVAKIESVLPALRDGKRLSDACSFFDAIRNVPQG